MNKKVIFVVAIIGLICGSVLFLLGSDSGNSPEQEVIKSGAQSAIQDESSTDSEASKKQAGSYINYSPSAVVDTDGTKLLFFHASWCPQCRDLETDIKTSTIPSGVTIMKVDYDTSQSLRQKYGVTIQTTVVRIDDNGDLVKKFVAYDDPSLEAIINNLLQ